MNTLLRRFAPALLLVGLALVFAGERIIGGDSPWRWLLSGVGAASVLTAAVARWSAWWFGQGPSRQAALASFIGYKAAAAALFVYALTTRELGFGADPDLSKLRTALSVTWVIALTCGLLIAIFADWSQRGLRDPARVEVKRVRAAARGGLSLGLAISWIFVVNYLGDQHDVRADWGGVASVEPGDGTLDLARNLQHDVEIVLFYPPSSDTLERITPYFDALAAHSPRLSVQTLDQAVEPARAEALGVRRGGVVAVVRGAETRQIPLDPDAAKAKRKLKDLDRDVQEALLNVSYEKRTLSFTVGHGERGAAAGDDGRAGTRGLRDWLKSLNVTLKDLGMAQGLGGEITDDAGIIAVIGPTSGLLPEEVESLRAWYRAGGSLLLMLDPAIPHGMEALLADLRVAIGPEVICHDRYHLRTSGGAADRAAIVTNRYGAHPLAKTLRKYSRTSFVAAEDAGAITIIDGSGPAPEPLVKPMAGSWLDANGDRERDDGETGQVGPLAVAVATGTEAGAGRAVVIADSDIAADGKINRPNLQLLTDALIWLARAGDAQLRVAEPVKDPPLVHTRDEDALWFWLTVAGVPLGVLAFGLLYLRRRARRTRRGAA